MFILGTFLYITAHVKIFTRVKVVVLGLADQTFETTVSGVCRFSCWNFWCIAVSEMGS